MDSAEFKIIYKGTSAGEAEKYSADIDGCAIVYCESGYGVAYIDGERAELTPQKAIALKWRGKSRGIPT